jgi:DNA repair exonuclease SbcCD nuclease subunit
VDIAKKHSAHIIDGGDFFHVKSPSRNSHRLVRQVAEVHKGVSVHANIGNHDCKYGDIENLPEQPLGVLYESGVFGRLYDEHEAVFEQGGFKVRVVGIPYHGTTYDLDRFKAITRGDEDYLVVVAHCLASKDGGEMFGSEDIIKYEFLDSLSEVDVWCFGHWHKNQGVHTLPPTQRGGVERLRYVVNVGSLTRGALTQDEMERIPEVVLMEFGHKGLQIRQIPLEVEDAKAVFNVEGRVRREVRESTMEAFVKNIEDALLRTEQKGLIDIVRDMAGIPDEVKEKAISLLEDAS